eukprot:scaffold358_cov343-Pavlova_lutheri.AAC.58
MFVFLQEGEYKAIIVIDPEYVRVSIQWASSAFSPLTSIRPLIRLFLDGPYVMSTHLVQGCCATYSSKRCHCISRVQIYQRLNVVKGRK